VPGKAGGYVGIEILNIKILFPGIIGIAKIKIQINKS